MHPLRLVLFSLFLLLSFSHCKKPTSQAAAYLLEESPLIDTYDVEINHVKKYAKDHGFNNEFAFMIDYGRHSGKFRFFVVDLKSSEIIKKGLVAHGTCKGLNKGSTASHFSNKENSYCTSLGMSVLGKRAYSKWGKNYKFWLDGLEDQNSNMRKRVVVLHGWEGVGDEEIFPAPLAMSWGCPTVSIKFLDELDILLKKEKKVLLFSFQN